MKHVFQCRICNSKNAYQTILNADMPLAANVIDEPSQGLARYPLNVVRCSHCGHVQLLDTLDIDLYDNYLYTPSYASGFVDYIQDFVNQLDNYMKEHHASKVLEIGSSNGFLLKKIKEKGWEVLGIEPSKTLADVSIQNGIDTIQDYFGDYMLDSIKEKIGYPDVVIMRHVLEHLDHLDRIIEAIKQLIGDGLLLIEVPYLCKIIEEKQFYAFFHEHLSYFSVSALHMLLNKSHLYIHQIYENSLEGGSILICANSNDSIKNTDNITSYLEAEQTSLSDSQINEFTKYITKGPKIIQDFIKCTTEKNKTVAAWGAGQRGCTLISLCGLQSDSLKYVIDSNKNYWWKYVPGTNIQIVPPDFYKNHPVDQIIIFATGYADSIMSQNTDFVANGGEFIKLKI